MQLKSEAIARAGLGVFTAAAFGVCAMTAQAQDVIELHNTMSPGGSEEAAMLRFKEVVEERSDGRFEVNVYTGGQLGDEVEILELLNLGQPQMALTGALFMGQPAEEYDAVSVTFVFPTCAAVEHYSMDTGSGKAMQQASLERGNLVSLGPQMRAYRHMTY